MATRERLIEKKRQHRIVLPLFLNKGIVFVVMTATIVQDCSSFELIGNDTCGVFLITSSGTTEETVSPAILYTLGFTLLVTGGLRIFCYPINDSAKTYIGNITEAISGANFGLNEVPGGTLFQFAYRVGTF